MKALNGGKLSEFTVREAEIALAYERDIERLKQQIHRDNMIIDSLRADKQALYAEYKKYERLYEELKKGETCK